MRSNHDHYMYEEWGSVDSQSHQARMERLRDWQAEYLESLAAEQDQDFAEWELEVGGYLDWLAFFEGSA